MLDKNNFRLQPVLNFKSGMVDTLEMEFARLKIAHQIEADVLLALNQTMSQEMDALRRQQQKDSLDCDAILLCQQYLQSLNNQVARQTTRVEAARHRVETKREELVKTMQDQKALEKLRDRHQTKQARELLRREARVVDDMVTTRYARER